MRIEKNYKDYLYFLIGESLIKNFSDEILINNFCSLHEIYNFRNNNDLLNENNEILLEILPAIAGGGAKAASAIGKTASTVAKAGSQVSKISSRLANGAKNAVNTAIKVGKNSIENIGKMSKQAVQNMKNLFKNVSSAIKEKGKSELKNLLNNKMPDMLKNSRPFIDDAIKQISDENVKSFFNQFKTISSKDALNDFIENSPQQSLIILKEVIKEKIYEICGALGIDFNKSNDIDKKDNQEKLLGVIAGDVIDTENIDPVVMQRLVACISFISLINDTVINKKDTKNPEDEDGGLETAEDAAKENIKQTDAFLSSVFTKADSKGS